MKPESPEKIVDVCLLVSTFGNCSLQTWKHYALHITGLVDEVAQATGTYILKLYSTVVVGLL